MACKNLSRQCRLCLSTSNSEICIFKTGDDKISLATKIMVCTSLVVTSDDDKPHYLCTSCQESLESFFEFRNKCLHTHIQLCFNADSTTVRTSSKNLTENSNLTDFCFELKKEHVEFSEEVTGEDHISTELLLPPSESEQQMQPDPSVAASEDKNDRRMECGNCLNGFYSLEELDEHWNSCGANKNEEWHKDLLKLNSINEDLNHINSNVRSVSTDNVNTSIESTNMKCVGCVKVFKDPKLFTEHLLAHSNGARYNCHECPKSFVDHYELKYHMRIHSVDDKYKCQDCGKSFPRPSSLRRHVLIHSGEKPYQCKVCSKTFGDSSNLLTHERIHTGEKPFKCRFCSKLFYGRSAKGKHERNHVRSNKMFQCDLCNRMFSTHEEMDEHFNLHDSQMIWKCKTCKQEFKKPSVLKDHSLKHHNDTLPFECEICFDSFALHIELKSHINVHTDDFS